MAALGTPNRQEHALFMSRFPLESLLSVGIRKRRANDCILPYLRTILPWFTIRSDDLSRDEWHGMPFLVRR